MYQDIYHLHQKKVFSVWCIIRFVKNTTKKLKEKKMLGFETHI